MSNSILTDEKKRIPSLDGWRALSIFFVLCSHCPISEGFPIQLKSFFKSIFDDGHLGVRCFFVISGFIINILLIDENANNAKIDLKKFYIRRSLRIFPVYYSYVLVVCLLQNTTHFSQPKVVWLQNLTFTTGFGFPAIFSWPTWHLWSLAVEEQFYLIWPFVFARLNQFNNKAAKIALFLPLVVAPIVRLLAYAGMGGEVFSFGVNKHTFLFNFDSIAIGCLGAFVYKMPTLPQWLLSNKSLVLGMFLVIVPEVLKRFYICGPLTVPFGNSLQSIGFMILILLSIVYFKETPFTFLNLKPIALFGRLSFSIYIWQQLFFGSEVFGFGNLRAV